ncbi:hypothetical protein N9A89_00220 [Akkermansiaceae bacterium]|nr:hypothetical protein [Akkermansiaceae bacterium]MDB4272147.1 hypothetical protein [bacterium]MDA7537888.1 hypothetical protein [Akkermansiaceae bacterium]MDA7863753.1 hypothetical protein [Akkermansiaceae bacterium]MDA7876471.1 hypothetical protein [Akkermansiaceae bacterium]
MAKAFWKARLVTAFLVILGSILILFPAWLPNHPRLPTEESAVEALQIILLLASAAFWFGSSRSAGETGPFYKIMGAGGIAAALGEIDGLARSISNLPSWAIFVLPAIYILVLFFKNRRIFPAFYTEFSTHPAAGFFASAFIMIYVLARFLGTPLLWKAALEANYHPDIPETVQGYLELLACYLLFVGSIGLCLRDRKHDPTED